MFAKFMLTKITPPLNRAGEDESLRGVPGEEAGAGEPFCAEDHQQACEGGPDDEEG